MFTLKFRNAFAGAVGLMLFYSVPALGVTITINSAIISSNFSQFSIDAGLSGFTDSGDISHFTAIVGLQNSSNSEEAIDFALATSFPSTGQSTPDHPVVPFPVGTDRRITATSVIVNLIDQQLLISGVLDGDWTVTQPGDYIVIVGLLNNANQEEGIVFSTFAVIAGPSVISVLGLGLVVVAAYRRQARRG